MIKKEDDLAGGSGGSAMSTAMLAAKYLGPGERCVVILADSDRNYISDQWMIDKFTTESEELINNHWWSNEKVSVLPNSAPLIVLPSISCQEAISIMQNEGYDKLPVVDKEGLIWGVVTLGDLMAKIISSKIKVSSPIQHTLYSHFKKITLDTTLRKLSGMLDRDHFALMVHSSRLYQGSVSKQEVVLAL